MINAVWHFSSALRCTYHMAMATGFIAVLPSIELKQVVL